MTERHGSTRLIRPVRPGVIAFTYTDFWSVFDRGPSTQLIPGLGASRCACAVKSFKLATEVGLYTHFVEQVDERTIHVREFLVPNREPLSGSYLGRVLPVEWIWRARAYGSLLERLEDGRMKPEELGFPVGHVVKKGEKLPEMRFEQTTKFESVDRHLTEEEARILCGLSEETWEACLSLIKKAIGASNAAYEAVGFMCPDGKLELGIRVHEFDGEIPVLVDVFGTQDENRIIDAEGNLFCKDLIRNNLKSHDEGRWKRVLEKYKEERPDDKNRWPPYPKLPEELVALVAERYAEVARRYAGVSVTY